MPMTARNILISVSMLLFVIGCGSAIESPAVEEGIASSVDLDDAVNQDGFTTGDFEPDAVPPSIDGNPCDNPNLVDVLVAENFIFVPSANPDGGSITSLRGAPGAFLVILRTNGDGMKKRIVLEYTIEGFSPFSFEVPDTSIFGDGSFESTEIGSPPAGTTITATAFVTFCVTEVRLGSITLTVPSL
jgi:hypothetical protein